LGPAEEALVELLADERRRERQVAAGQPLPPAEEVRGDALALAGPERAGATESHRHLVADQEASDLVAELARTRQPALGCHQDAGGRPEPAHHKESRQI